MIKLHKLCRQEFVLNAELIQSVEATPDTTITLQSGIKYSVQESIDEVIALVIAYKRAVAVAPLLGSKLDPGTQIDGTEAERLSEAARTIGEDPPERGFADHHIRGR